MKRWQNIFRTLLKGIIHPSGIFRTLCNACMHRILEYSDPFHNCTLMHHIFRNLSYYRKFMNIQNSNIFKSWHIYIQYPLKDFKLSSLGKIVKSYNYFSKVLHLKFLTRLWTCLSLKKYSLTCRVTSHCVLYDAYIQLCLLL